MTKQEKRMEIPASIFRMLFHHKLATVDALSELIDNAFGPAAGNATECHIDFIRTHVIFIDNGVGVRDLNALMTPGCSVSRNDPEDIGSYGIGGQFGMLHFGKKVHVLTRRDGKLHFHWVDYGTAVETGELPANYYDGKWDYTEKFYKDNEKFVGTRIEIGDLHKGKHKPSYDHICKVLAHRYFLAQQQGKKIFISWPGSGEERELKADNVIQLFEQDVREFTGEVNGKPFKVVAGDTKNYNPSLNGLWIGFGYRFIRCEKALNGRSLPSRFYGRVILGPEWKYSLSPDKLDVDIDKDELCEAIYTLLADWIELLRQYSEEVRTNVICLQLSQAFQEVIRLKGKGDEYEAGPPVGVGKAKKKRPPLPVPPIPPDPTVPSGIKTPEGNRAGQTKKKPQTGIRFNFEALRNTTPCLVRPDNETLLCVLNTDLPPIDYARQAPFKLNVIWPICSMAIASLCRSENEWARRLFPEVYEQIDVNEPSGLQQLYDLIAAKLIKAQPDAKTFTDEVERNAA